MLSSALLARFAASLDPREAPLEANVADYIAWQSDQRAGEREVEVWRWVAQGMKNREIGAQLNISEKTVGHHLEHIYNKIGT